MLNRKLFFSLFLLVAFLLGISSSARADYIGPNRTVTGTVVNCQMVLWEYQWVSSKNEWRYRKVDTWSCGDESKAWLAYSDTPSNTPGDQYYSTEQVITNTTVTYPPATISNTLQNCTNHNGWCNTAAKLYMTGTEPVAGYSITSIEGLLNGQAFTCSGTSCSVALHEGDNSFTFWAHSSWGDTSAMGIFSARLDTVSPLISSSVTSGTLGANGWYISPALFSAMATDVTSGVGTILISDNGGAGVTGSRLLDDGVHNLTVTATDKAGNLSREVSSIKVDTTPPMIIPMITADSGANGWLVSSGTVSATVTDAASGVNGEVEVSLDGGSSWQALPLTLEEGVYALTFHAFDSAGNEGSATLPVSIDKTNPELSFVLEGTPGANGWYVSNVKVTPLASDSLSGLDTSAVRANGGAWLPSVTLSDGVHIVEASAFDRAGNTSTLTRELRIDTEPPTSLFVGQSNHEVVSKTVGLGGLASDTGSGVQSLEISFDSGGTWLPAILSGDTWSFKWDTSLITNGVYTAWVRATDAAGNVENPTASLTLIVDNLPPQVTLTDWWWIWESGPYRVSENTFPIAQLEVVIRDPQARWKPVVIQLKPNKTTGSITWDRHFAEIHAPSGNYKVTLTACDIHGNCASEKGVIKIPFVEPDVPTMTPTVLLPTPSWEVPTQETVIHNFIATPPAMPPIERSQVAQMSGHQPKSSWVLLILELLALLFGVTAILDPRPKALHSLARTIQQYNKEFEQQ